MQYQTYMESYKDKAIPSPDTMCYDPEGWVRNNIYITCPYKYMTRNYLGTFFVYPKAWFYTMLWRHVTSFLQEKKKWSLISIYLRFVMAISSVFLIVAGTIRFFILSKRKTLSKDVANNWLYFVKMASCFLFMHDVCVTKLTP